MAELARSLTTDDIGHGGTVSIRQHDPDRRSLGLVFPIVSGRELRTQRDLTLLGFTGRIDLRHETASLFEFARDIQLFVVSQIAFFFVGRRLNGLRLFQQLLTLGKHFLDSHACLLLVSQDNSARKNAGRPNVIQ